MALKILMHMLLLALQIIDHVGNLNLVEIIFLSVVIFIGSP